MPAGRCDADELLALGASAVPALTAFVASWPGSDPGDHARGHAADLLAELHAIESLPTLLAALADNDCPQRLWEHLRSSLPRFGADLIAPALDALAAPAENLSPRSVCEVLSACGVRDERILAALLDCFAEDMGAVDHLVAYGDVAALPAIREAVESFDPDPVTLSEIHPIFDCVSGLEHFGVATGDELRANVARWRLQGRAATLARSAVVQEHGVEIANDPAELKEAVRRRMPRLDLVEYAQPLLERCTSVQAKLAALHTAETLERIALLGRGPLQERALKHVLDALPESGGLRKKMRPLFRTMIARFYELFPERKPQHPARLDLDWLRLFARASLDKGLEALTSAGAAVDDMVYVVADASRAPGRTIAIAYFKADGETVDQVARRIDLNAAAFAARGEAFVVATLMQPSLVLGFLAQVRIVDPHDRASVGIRLRAPLPARHVRVVLMAGSTLAAEDLPLSPGLIS